MEYIIKNKQNPENDPRTAATDKKQNVEMTMAKNPIQLISNPI